MIHFSDLPAGISYADYQTLTQEHAANGLTSGPNQSDALAHYTKLNAQRMKRLDKTVALLPEVEAALSKLRRKYRWVVFTETWCGDAAQILPVLHHMAGNDIELTILFRDEDPALFDHFLTDGSRSIPKLAAFDAETGTELGQWGPRPAPLQAIVMDYRKQPGTPYEVISEEIQRWYNQDKTRLIQQEILRALQEWELAGE